MMARASPILRIRRLVTLNVTMIMTMIRVTMDRRKRTGNKAMLGKRKNRIRKRAVVGIMMTNRCRIRSN